MKEIIHITNSNKYGGAESVIFYMATISNKTYQNLLFIPKGGTLNQGIEDLPFKEIKEYTSLIQLYSYLKNKKDAIVIAHDITASIKFSLLPLKRKAVSVIHSPRPFFYKKSLMLSSIQKMLSSRYGRVVFVNKKMKDFKFGASFINTVEILNNVISKDRVLKKSTLFKPDKKYDLAFLGRFEKEKDPKKFVEIVQMIQGQSQDIKAVMIGDGSLMGNVKQQIEDLKLENNIDLKGFQSNPYPLLLNSKILVMSSKYESVGISAIEALCLGRVVCMPISCYDSSIAEKGIFFCSDIEDYSKTISALLSNGSFMQNQMKLAIKSFMKKNDEPSYKNKFFEIIQNS